MELPPVPPLPEGLIGMNWSWTGPPLELYAPPEQPPTPPTTARMPPADLWVPPPFIDLCEDDDDDE